MNDWVDDLDIAELLRLDNIPAYYIQVDKAVRGGWAWCTGPGGANPQINNHPNHLLHWVLGWT